MQRKANDNVVPPPNKQLRRTVRREVPRHERQHAAAELRRWASMTTAVRHCVACGKARPATEEFCPFCTAPAKPVPPRARSDGAAVDTHLETRWGGGPTNPTAKELRAALAELDTPDEEHPNAWLTDQDGWTVDVYEGGLVIFSDNEEQLVERRGVTKEEAFALWLLLQQGKRDEIRRRLSP